MTRRDCSHELNLRYDTSCSLTSESSSLKKQSSVRKEPVPGNPLLDKAINLLSYRAHSRKELADKLKRKTGCEEAELEEVLNRLEELGFLNDASYAASVVRSCTRKGYGSRRAAAELARRGISKALSEEALAEMPETDDTLDRLLRSKLHDPGDRDAVRKVSAAMLRRGYSWEEIRKALERLGSETEEEST